MSSLICPGYVSNITSAKCVGDVQINSPEVAGVLFFGLIILLMAAWSALYIKKKMGDANRDKGVKNEGHNIY